MDLGIKDRTALVTGGSKGIGRAIAATLAQEGVKVALTSRDQATADEAAAQIPNARGFAFDSADLDAIPALLDAVGPLDIYIANTGGPPPGDPLGFTRAQWETAHRTLVLSPMEILAQILPGMRERGFGRVVAIGSMAVTEPLDPLQLSNVHRPGLVVGFKVLAREYARDNVTLNHVHPGRIATARLADTDGSLAGAQEYAKQTVPAARLGTPEELAAAAVFLCSVQAAYITGTSILVDGGVTRSA
jgi:3-oxoacyl-[acyl-carrier protein] reductase